MNQQVLGHSRLQRRRAPRPDVLGDHPSRRSARTPRLRCASCSPGPSRSTRSRSATCARTARAVWSLTTVTLLKDAAGQPQRFIGVIEDITRAQARRSGAARGDPHPRAAQRDRARSLASKLDLQALVQAVTDAATQLSGAQFGAFFYNTTDENGDAFLLYTLSGAPREAFEKFGQPRATRAVRPDLSRRSADPLRRRAERIRATARWRRITACRQGICRCAAIWPCRCGRAPAR